ncbi:MAG: sigma-54-dependent transcriptional regulator [Spirochaetota bacterium]
MFVWRFYLASVVVLGSDATAYRVIKQLLGPDHRVEHYENTLLAVEYVNEKSPDIVFLNLEESSCDALDLLSRISFQASAAAVVGLVATIEVRRIVDAVKRGACDVLPRPLRERDLQLAVTRALAQRQLRRTGTPQLLVPEIVGVSGSMIALRAQIGKVAAVAGPVVVTGESGVGKELVAQAIHRLSPVSAGPIIARNCGAFPESLMESELFGTERGAYTDAIRRPGAFGLANGGTLFLDEIGDLSLSAQVKLLRVLESGTYYRVGGTQVSRTTVRFVGATNLCLRDAVRSGTFREDLYYRINVFRLHIPPLRERREDIPLLVRHFVRLLSDNGSTGGGREFGADALQRISDYDWPGNVRELRNVVWRALVDATSPVVRASDLTFD